MSKKTNKTQEVINYLYIIIGSLALAFAVMGFLAPNKIATGGTAGLAIIFNYLFNVPTGLIMVLINIPLLAVSLKYLGKTFAFKTITCIALTSLFIDIIAGFELLPSMSSDLLLATLYGGIVAGLGLGLVFKGGASAGGGTILAKIITSKVDIKTGTVILILDAIVVSSAGFVFNSVEAALWSLISIFATSKVIDLVLTGRPSQKIVHISSFQNLNALAKNISETLGVNGTIMNGQDLTLGEHKDMIFIVVDKNRLSALQNLVYQYDSKARMIVMEATEMLGKNNRI